MAAIASSSFLSDPCITAVVVNGMIYELSSFHPVSAYRLLTILVVASYQLPKLVSFALFTGVISEGPPRACSLSPFSLTCRHLIPLLIPLCLIQQDWFPFLALTADCHCVFVLVRGG